MGIDWGSASDQELWSQATNELVGEAFGELFERHADRVYAHCFSRTGSWSMAEDLTSVVFLEAWRKRTARADSGSIGQAGAPGQARGYRGRDSGGRPRDRRAVLATGAAAIAAAVYQPVTNKTDSRCFTAEDTSGFGTVIADAGKPGTKGAVQNARQVCAALYRQGFLTRGAQRINPRPGQGVHPVPPLVVCTWQDGTAAVFPGSNWTCVKLGLRAAARR